MWLAGVGGSVCACAILLPERVLYDQPSDRSHLPGPPSAAALWLPAPHLLGRLLCECFCFVALQTLHSAHHTYAGAAAMKISLLAAGIKVS